MWSVRLERVDQLRIGGSAAVTSGEVLRFSSADGLICDLDDYPSDWDRFTEKGLLSLLGQAMAAWSRPTG